MKRVIASLVILMSLTACEATAERGITSKPVFAHNYTEEQLGQAKPFIRNEVIATWSEFRKKRSQIGERSLGVVHGMTIPNGDGTFDVWVVDYLTPTSTTDVLEHEYGHVFDHAVLGIADTADHPAPNWHLPNAFKDRVAAARERRVAQSHK